MFDCFSAWLLAGHGAVGLGPTTRSIMHGVNRFLIFKYLFLGGMLAARAHRWFHHFFISVSWCPVFSLSKLL